MIATFGGASAATPVRRLLPAQWRIASGRKPNDNDPPVDPYTWILLAEDALSGGRTEHAEELIEQAYRTYDEAILTAATWWLGSEEEETEVDSRQIGEPTQMRRHDSLLPTLIGSDPTRRHMDSCRNVVMVETELKAPRSEPLTHEHIDRSASTTAAPATAS